MKRVGSAVLVLTVLAMLVASCAPAATPTPQVITKVQTQVVTKVETQVVEKVITATPPPKGKVVRLAFIVNVADHPYIQALINAFKAEAARFGVEAEVFDPRFDANVQASLIEQAIAAKFDGIGYIAVDAAACGPQLEKAHNAGIKIITMASPVADALTPLVDSFVGADMWDQGRAVAEMVKDVAGDKAVKIVIVEGMAGTTGAQGRTEGFEEKAKALMPNAQIIAKQPADWNRNKALEITQNLLTRFDKIDVVYAHDDDMAQGCIQAIEAAGRQKEMTVFGVGGMCEGYKAIEAGKMYGTVDQAPSLISIYTVRTLLDLINGVPVNKENLIPLPKITKANLTEIACEW